MGEQRAQALTLTVGQQADAGVEGATGLVEGIVLTASALVELLLDTATAVVQGVAGQVRSGRSALSALLLVGFSGPSPEPDVRLPPHPALHEYMPQVRRRRCSAPTVSGSSFRGSGNG